MDVQPRRGRTIVVEKAQSRRSGTKTHSPTTIRPPRSVSWRRFCTTPACRGETSNGSSATATRRGAGGSIGRPAGWSHSPTHATVAADETKVSTGDGEVHVWATVDVDTVEVVHIEMSPGRSGLDALVSLKTILKRCRGQQSSW